MAEKSEDEWTLDKVASLGLAGVLSIAVAESVFWILSFPISELLYFVSTGEWINLLEQVTTHFRFARMRLGSRAPWAHALLGATRFLQA